MDGFLPTRAAAIALLLVSAVTVARPAESRETRAPRALLSDIEQSATSIRLSLRTARAEGELTRARCLSMKLSEVHAQQRQAERNAADLKATRDAQSSRRYRYLLESAADYARDLSAEARRCGARRNTGRRALATSTRVVQ